jgi:hypothetical protein
MRLPDFHRSQQLGLFETKLPLGLTDRLKHKIYSSIRPSASSAAAADSTSNNAGGGIFNLEFNETGNILIGEQCFFFQIVTSEIVYYNVT